MENNINISTAEEARYAVKNQVELECGKVWEDVLNLVKNRISVAVNGCEYKTYISEQYLKGLPSHIVYAKLAPELRQLGYEITTGTYGSGIWISWEEPCIG